MIPFTDPRFEVDNVILDKRIGWVQCLIGALGVTISICCIFYINSKLTVNPVIKKMLLGTSIHQLISFLILICTAIIVFHAENLGPMTNFFLLLNLTGLVESSLLISTLISIIRLNFCIKISKMQVPNMKKIESNVLKAMLLHYLIRHSN